MIDEKGYMWRKLSGRGKGKSQNSWVALHLPLLFTI